MIRHSLTHSLRATTLNERLIDFPTFFVRSFVRSLSFVCFRSLSFAFVRSFVGGLSSSSTATLDFGLWTLDFFCDETTKGRKFVVRRRSSFVVVELWSCVEGAFGHCWGSSLVCYYTQ